MTARGKLRRLTSGKTIIRTVCFLDPRCWRTFWHLRLLWKEHRGFMPSRDWVLSELLINPWRGAAMLQAVAERMTDQDCPLAESPKGNRFRTRPNPNVHYQSGPDRPEYDWGVASIRERENLTP